MLDKLKEAAQEITLHGAADAAVVHLDHFLIGSNQQMMVDANLAELVHDDRNAPSMLGGEDAVEQRRLARAEKAGEDNDGGFSGAGLRHLGRVAQRAPQKIQATLCVTAPVRTRQRAVTANAWARAPNGALCPPYMYQCAGVMPRSLAASASLARCSAMALTNSGGPPTLSICPVSVSLSSTIGSFATSLMSRAMRSRCASAIPSGPNSPTSPSRVRSG